MQCSIQAARRTFDQGHWSKSHARTRHDILRKTAEAESQGIRTGTDTLKKLEDHLQCVWAKCCMTAEVYDYFAGLALDLKGESITQYTEVRSV